MRETHTLKMVNGRTLPSSVAALDVDCLLELPPPSGGAAKYRVQSIGLAATRLRQGSVERRWEITTQAALWPAGIDSLCRRGQSVWLFGRNLYRSLVALDFFARLNGTDWTLRLGGDPARNGDASTAVQRRSGFVVLEPRCTILCCYRVGGGSLNCVDLANYGVQQLPGWSGCPQKNATLVLDWAIDWIDWLRRTDSGTMKYTIGSQAMYAWRKHYLRHPVVVHPHEPALKLEMNALHGGRCEAYRIGMIPGGAVHVDASSLYGAMAATAQVPTVLAGYDDHGDLTGPGEGHAVIADVTVRSDTPSVPCRWPGKSITVWPTGTFRTQLCGPELCLVAEHVREVHQIAWYATAPLLAEWATWCWQERQAAATAGKPAILSAMKLWSQVLYGKFAQHQRGWVHYPQGVTHEPWALWYQWDQHLNETVAYRAIAGRVERHVDGGLTDQACPAIAAWISSLARVWMWRAINAAGRSEVYYCDTDSLILSATGLSRLEAGGFPVGDGLGQLRVVGRHKSVEIRGYKHYILDGAETCAGLRTSPPLDGGVEPINVACLRGRPPLAIRLGGSGLRQAKYLHGCVSSDGLVRPWKFE